MANYLYGGVELAAWPNTPYKYAAIFHRKTDEEENYQLHCSESGFECNGSSGLMRVRGDNVKYFLMDGNGNITLQPDGEWVQVGEYSGGLYFSSVSLSVLWSSHDIPDPNGGVFFEATPAINAETGEEVYYSPVTVPEPIDPKSLTAGWRVGQLIAAMRNA